MQGPYLSDIPSLIPHFGDKWLGTLALISNPTEPHARKKARTLIGLKQRVQFSTSWLQGYNVAVTANTAALVNLGVNLCMLAVHA